MILGIQLLLSYLLISSSLFSFLQNVLYVHANLIIIIIIMIVIVIVSGTEQCSKLDDVFFYFIFLTSKLTYLHYHLSPSSLYFFSFSKNNMFCFILLFKNPSLQYSLFSILSSFSSFLPPPSSPNLHPSFLLPLLFSLPFLVLSHFTQ